MRFTITTFQSLTHWATSAIMPLSGLTKKDMVTFFSLVLLMVSSCCFQFFRFSSLSDLGSTSTVKLIWTVSIIKSATHITFNWMELGDGADWSGNQILFLKFKAHCSENRANPRQDHMSFYLLMLGPLGMATGQPHKTYTNKSAAFQLACCYSVNGHKLAQIPAKW